MNAHNEQQALPCPFCAREPDLSFNSVSCGCAASPFIDREDALQVWNTRAAQPSPVVKQNLTTQLAAAQEAVAIEVPNGAIFNGNAYADRLETYGFECEAGPLTNCNDWVELRRCFNHLADWAYSLPPIYAAPVTAAPGIDLQERLTRSYSERNALAIAFARAAIAAGWPAGRGFDADADKDWNDDWRHVIYVDIPNGTQVSWHVSPKEVPLLEGLPEYNGKWDGTFVARNQSWCQFDASPKGALNEQFGSAEGLDSHASMEAHYRQALERIASQGPHYGPDGTRETWQHWCEIARDALADSPKGGRDLIACVDRIEEAIEHRVPHDIYGTVHVELAEIRRLAQAGDAEVQP